MSRWTLRSISLCQDRSHHAAFIPMWHDLPPLFWCPDVIVASLQKFPNPCLHEGHWGCFRAGIALGRSHISDTVIYRIIVPDHLATRRFQRRLGGRFSSSSTWRWTEMPPSIKHLTLRVQYLQQYLQDKCWQIVSTPKPLHCKHCCKHWTKLWGWNAHGFLHSWVSLGSGLVR